jgi:signal peptidase
MLRTGLVIGFLACLVAAAAFLLLTRDVYVVQSPSMKPTLRPGDAVVVKPVDGLVEPGQVVTYEMQGKLITHRVVRVDGDGIYTKGDAADEEDPWQIPRSAVRGQMDFRIPYGGYVILFLRQPLGALSVIALPVLLLFGMEGGRRRKTAGPGRQAPTQPMVGPVKRRGSRTVALLGLLAVVVALALVAQGDSRQTAPPKPAARAAGPAKAGLGAAVLLVAALLVVVLHVGGVLGFFGGTNNQLLTISTAPSFEPIPASVDIDPDTLNPGSQGRFVTAYIELPEGWDVADIDVSTVTLEIEGAYGSVPAELTPTEVGDHDGGGIPHRMVKFSREAVIALLGGRTGDVAFKVRGEVSGSPFEGTDTIRVLDSQGDAEDSEPALPEEGSGEAAAPPEPPPPTPSMPTMEYEVKPGDTLSDIGRRFGADVGTLVQLNGLEDPGVILYGSTLKVPYVGEDAGSAAAGLSPQHRRASVRGSGE